MHERLVDTLVAAFFDDPLYLWLFPDRTTRPGPVMYVMVRNGT